MTVPAAEARTGDWVPTANDSSSGRRRVLLLLGPGLGWITVVYVVPALLIVVYSFLTPRLGGGARWEPTLDSYRAVFSYDPRAAYYNNFLTVFLRSIVWAGLATLICIGVALPLAVFIARRRSTVAKLALLVAVIIPFWTSMLVRTYAIRFLLANTGPLNELLETVGLGRQTFLNTRFAVVLGLVYTALPFMILPLYAAVERSDRNQLEAGRDLGAAPAQLFWRVFVPMIRPGLVVGSIMVFVLSVSQFLVPTLLGGNKTNMVANLLALQFGDAFNWPLGAAIAVLFSLITIAGLLAVTRRTERGDLL